MIINPVLPCGYVIFADDVRNETNGKISLIGCYGGEMTVYSDGPSLLPQICAVITYLDDPHKFPKNVSIKLLKDERDTEGKTTTTEIASSEITFEMPDQDLLEIADDDDGNKIPIAESRIVMRMSPFEVKSDCNIKVRAVTDGNEHKLGQLDVKLKPPPINSQP